MENEQTQTQRINRNGRNGSLTSWDRKAKEKFKTFYTLYSQFKDRIYLEDEDIKTLISYYHGKREAKDELRRFIVRQFRLMGYPQDNKSKMQKRGYIEVNKGFIVLDFGFNIDRRNNDLFLEYMRVNRLNGQNEAIESPIIKEKAEGNIKPLTENVYNQDLKGGVIE